MMGFNPTFYAGRPKLSEVTIDSDLDMGARNIRANELRAARVYSPIDTDVWPTERLDWGDGEPSVLEKVTVVSRDSEDVVLTYSMGSATQKLQVRQTLGGITNEYQDAQIIELKCDGVSVLTQSFIGGDGETKTSSARWCTGEVTVTLRAHSHRWQYNTVELLSTGYVGGEKTFDLAGKWLALGIDMRGLAASVKIQGVEMPYSDYAKYFPLAPSEVKIPGDWTPKQNRPDIEVYV